MSEKKNNSSSSSLIDEREEVMVSEKGLTLKKTHFLTSIDGVLEPQFPLRHQRVSVSSSLSSHISFSGFRISEGYFIAWLRKMEPLYETIWRKAGIFEAIKASTYNIVRNQSLILSVADKWCPETKSFFFPFGEATITLEDVMLLLGFSVLGSPVFVPLESLEMRDCAEKLHNEKKQCSGDHRVSAYRRPSISSEVIPIAIRLARGERIALAPAVLASVYRDLDHIHDLAVEKHCDEDVTMKSLFKLVQVWTWERFSNTRPKALVKEIPKGGPRISQWGSLVQRSVDNVRLGFEDFDWRPYTKPLKNWNPLRFYVDEAMWVTVDESLDDEFASFARCVRASHLVGDGFVESYYPNRVARQFGLDQDLPGFVTRRSNFTEKEAWDDYNKSLNGLKLYMPSHLARGSVTKRYQDWWLKSVSSIEEMDKETNDHYDDDDDDDDIDVSPKVVPLSQVVQKLEEGVVTKRRRSRTRAKKDKRSELASGWKMIIESERSSYKSVQMKRARVDDDESEEEDDEMTIAERTRSKRKCSNAEKAKGDGSEMLGERKRRRYQVVDTDESDDSVPCEKVTSTKKEQMSEVSASKEHKKRLICDYDAEKKFCSEVKKEEGIDARLKQRKLEEEVDARLEQRKFKEEIDARLKQKKLEEETDARLKQKKLEEETDARLKQRKLEEETDARLEQRKLEEEIDARLKQRKLAIKEMALKLEERVMTMETSLANIRDWKTKKVSSLFCAHGLHFLAEQIGSVLYYKKSVEKAKLALSFIQELRGTRLETTWGKNVEDLESLIKNAELKIAESKTSPLNKSESKVCESKKDADPLKNEKKELRKYWVGLDIEIKRDFLKVSAAELLSFTEEVHNRDGRDTLEAILASAREDRKWTFWMCRTLCSKKFSSAEECREHLEQKHAADFKPSSEKDMVKRIGRDWGSKIFPGAWKPLDAVAAVEMIKNPLKKAETFKSNSGWSKEWPLAEDEDERSKLLEEIKSLLKSIRDHNVLSSSIRDWLIDFPVRQFGKLKVYKKTLADYHLVRTPQSICFLDCHDLIHIRDFLKNIKCERDDGTDLVSRAVDSFLGRTRVKETIDFDHEFSVLLLDKRLLKSISAPTDDKGTINEVHPDNHYAEAHAKGDAIISWLVDYASVDKIFPRPIREHNLDIWVAVLRAVQLTCRTLETKYAKKVQVLDYVVALTAVENFRKSEDDRRKNLQEDQWNSYASLLCDRCEQSASENSLSTKSFLCAVLDVLNGTAHPTYDFSNLEDCMRLIREHKSCKDDLVLNSIHRLKSVLTQKDLLIDSKILLIDNSRIRLLDNLTRLSVFDNRTYMLRLLKPFLLNKIVNMERKAKSDAAFADLLLEETKSQSMNKMINKNTKRTSTSMSSPLDKIVKDEPEGKSMEPGEDALASERGRLEATKTDHDMQKMPEHLESMLGKAAAIYNSAFDMTLKALLNAKVLKEDLKHNGDLGEQVPCALRNFFTAFGSEVIKNEENYRILLSDLLASLNEVNPMSSDAAEVLVDILEFWHCWKTPERESVVTLLFTYEEKERVSCRKCRRESNDPEQSAYGIVVAAHSVRELKGAFGYMKFVDILKLIRMENKMQCDVETGGCGKTNYVHHIINKSPPIFTIVLEWEKSETEKEISETTKALDWEIDMSRLYEGLEPNTNYRLVSMVGCCEEEHICLAYEKTRWVNLKRESFAGEVVGDWKKVVKFCEERKVRPEILFYEAAGSR
ncbi:hypothetical protein AALP_AA8G449800 [Arabis alpina]|uniref:C2H2-type domain-containing protein n=1 Tax=Arabis alpina TaxID=50452 RepID=A0A087GDI1_ARAAL|nr:hypothetical protein AALP_AA8G449800 [Arabis alpina]